MKLLTESAQPIPAEETPEITEPETEPETETASDTTEILTETATEETASGSLSLFSPLTAYAEEAAEAPEENPVIRLSFLTAKDGLPESASYVGGLRQPSYEAPVLERDARSDRKNKFQASVFGNHGALTIVLGSAAVLAAVVTGAVLHRKTKPRTGKER